MHRWKNPSYSHYARIRELAVGEVDEALCGLYPKGKERVVMLSCREDCTGAAVAELLMVVPEIRLQKVEGRHLMLACLQAAHDVPPLIHGLTQRGLLAESEFAQVKAALAELGKSLNWGEEAANWRGTDI